MKEGGGIDFPRAARARPGRANGPAGPRRRPKGTRGEGGRGRGNRWAESTSRGPEWDLLVGGSAHRERGASSAAIGFGGGHGAHARLAEDADAAGPRAASRLAVDRAHEQSRGERRTGVSLTRSRPRWRLRGSHAGRQEEDNDAGRNGRRTVAASGGAIYGDAGEGEHTGRLHGTRGDEPTARIRRREFDGGGFRRRRPAARKEGNGDGAIGVRFLRTRASTRLPESVCSVGLDGDTMREAGDVRTLSSMGGDGGEHTASGGSGRGRGGRWCARSPCHASSLVPAPPTRATTSGGGEQGRTVMVRRLGANSGERRGTEREGEGRLLWAWDGASRGRNRASRARSNGTEDGLARRGCPSAMALAPSGGRAEAGLREESGKRRGERELEPCQFGEERDGSGRHCLRVLDERGRRGSGTRTDSWGRAATRRQARQGSGAGRRRRGTGGDRAGARARQRRTGLRKRGRELAGDGAGRERAREREKEGGARLGVGSRACACGARAERG
uniref:Epstein-Barr virus EBNA-1-like protein n=1 Tax=Oryza sativa subsp. japonica TaxID=39947 RepID=Q6ZDF0_ORYSJ|nr:Epstein-Barr virus EBNA-1-like protein [Oryza sativa Japonica Group]